MDIRMIEQQGSSYATNPTNVVINTPTSKFKNVFLRFFRNLSSDFILQEKLIKN